VDECKSLVGNRQLLRVSPCSIQSLRLSCLTQMKTKPHASMYWSDGNSLRFPLGVSTTTTVTQGLTFRVTRYARDFGHQWDIDRDIDMRYGLSIWDMAYRYGHPGYRCWIWANDMRDGCIDMVIVDIDMGYLDTLLTHLYFLGLRVYSLVDTLGNFSDKNSSGRAGKCLSSAHI